MLTRTTNPASGSLVSLLQCRHAAKGIDSCALTSANVGAVFFFALVSLSSGWAQVENLGFKLARLETSYEEVKAQCEEHSQVGTHIRIPASACFCETHGWFCSWHNRCAVWLASGS